MSLVDFVRGAFVATALTACGETSYLILEVHADLAIPTQADRLDVSVFKPGVAEPFATWRLPLEAGLFFPLDIGIEPSEETPKTLEARVRAVSQDATAGYAAKAFTWQRDRAVRVTMTLK